jgi:hypothetical protein
MKALVHGHILAYAVQSPRIVPPALLLDQWNAIRSIAINLVGTDEAEGGLWREIASSDKKIESADGILVEVLVRNTRSLVMRWLSSSVDDQIWPL